jgi:flagellar hook-basal body complex protein FliE
MSIDAIAALGAASITEAQTSTILPPRADFGAAIERGLASTNEALQSADQNVRLLASGQEIATHDVMISLEGARMQLMLLSEVRNRVVEAYQELSRMQL